jgi:hypothetical protein
MQPAGSSGRGSEHDRLTSGLVDPRLPSTMAGSSRTPGTGCWQSSSAWPTRAVRPGGWPSAMGLPTEERVEFRVGSLGARKRRLTGPRETVLYYRRTHVRGKPAGEGAVRKMARPPRPRTRRLAGARETAFHLQDGPYTGKTGRRGCGEEILAQVPVPSRLANPASPASPPPAPSPAPERRIASTSAGLGVRDLAFQFSDLALDRALFLLHIRAHPGV